MKKEIEFEQISTSDLIKDSLFKGGKANNLSSEPISKIFPVGNQSGIRFSGTFDKPGIVVLYSTFNDLDWPDSLENKILTYYGDNKDPGREVHERPGNKLLRTLFDFLHLNKKERIPPIFLFEKGDAGFDRIYRGILVPGNVNYDESEDLVALWKTKSEKRFQNYRAIFSLLAIDFISRKWVNDIIAGNKFSENCPIEWNNWIHND
jgi:AspBHI-like restriction endonuclease